MSSDHLDPRIEAMVAHLLDHALALMRGLDTGKYPEAVTAADVVLMAQVTRDCRIIISDAPRYSNASLARIAGDVLTLARHLTALITIQGAHHEALLEDYTRQISALRERARIESESYFAHHDNLSKITDRYHAMALDAQRRARSWCPIPVWRGLSLREMLAHLIIVPACLMPARWVTRPFPRADKKEH